MRIYLEICDVSGIIYNDFDGVVNVFVEFYEEIYCLLEDDYFDNCFKYVIESYYMCIKISVFEFFSENDVI